MKVVGIEKGRKPDAPCPYCGAEKACPDFTCPRIASIQGADDGWWQIDFAEDWQPHEPDPAA